METTTTETTAPKKTCKCGHDRTHHMVSPHGDYGFIGWLGLLMGATAEPRRVKFTCRVCGQTFDESTDPVVRKKHAGS